VLTSNFFFLASCTGGLGATWLLMQKVGGEYLQPGMKADDAMVVVAAVPDPAKPGAVQVQPVHVRNMEKFKAANPTHSFLLPSGSGQIREENSDRSTRYDVQAVRDGTVLVETKHRQEMGGLLIMRYEATDKSVRPIFTNNVQWIGAFPAGFLFAFVLYIVGRILRYRANRDSSAALT